MTVTNQAELEGLQAIGRIVATTLQAMARAMEPGMTTRELDGIGRALRPRTAMAFPARPASASTRRSRMASPATG